MKAFFDTEFTGLHQRTTLISIGLVSETGESFYAELTDYDRSQLNDWLNENVIVHLRLPDTEEPCWMREIENVVEVKGTQLYVRNNLETWLRKFNGNIEMWSDCLAYDWVLFCELWGGAMNIPKCVYYIPFDICTLLKLKGIDPDINREQFANMRSHGQKHNALWDAEVIQACYQHLMALNVL